MKTSADLLGASLVLLAVFVEVARPTCVLESDFGFKINCAFKKSGLFRVRNLGGVKAHASIGFSLGDELGFEQSLTNLDPSRRRSVSLKNGATPNFISDTSTGAAAKQEKRGKQNRIMMRPMAPPSRPNQAAMDRLTSLHRHGSTTMRPIVVSAGEAPTTLNKVNPTVTIIKQVPIGTVPPFRPLPPKEESLKVLPMPVSTRKTYTPLQIPQSKGPGLRQQSENYPFISYDQVSNMISQMTSQHVGHSQPILRITPAPMMAQTPKLYSVPSTINPFVPMPVAAPPVQAMTIISAPNLKYSSHTPHSPSASNSPIHTFSVHKTNPISNFVDPVPHQVQDLASLYPAYSTKKVDDYNSITGYGDDTTLKFNKEDINAKIAEIAKAGNISMEAVEAAIALRQQQLLNKYANVPMPTTSTTTTTTTTTEEPLVFREPEPEIIVATQKPRRNPTSGKVMNAPREYYPVGYEKNFDDHFQTKVDLPDTNFHCGDQKYFPGLYGDETLGCMVFHVCALTDDGLVMKSFLCPESTLFDQTILKCNWWFYVDCKNTRRLYDTNIPVSKSYQLMKALTFFSSYKKDTQDDVSSNPEDVEGIKEAISILENQDTKSAQSGNAVNTVHIVTPQTPYVDERHNHKTLNDSSPVYRGNRNYNTNITSTRKLSARFKTSEPTQKPEFKLVTVNANVDYSKNISSKSSESFPSTSSENTSERKHRRRMKLRSNNSTSSSTTEASKLVEKTSIPAKTDNVVAESKLEVKQEKLIDQVDLDPAAAENSPPVKRVYRSSAEKEDAKEEKEMALVNDEKVQIVRPTSQARLVGEYGTPTATIAKLDEAVLGHSRTVRSYKDSASSLKKKIRSPTNRLRT